MKKLVLVITTVALIMTMAFSVSAGSKFKVSNIYSNTTKVKVKFPKKTKYKVIVKVKKPGTKKYKKLKTVKTKKVKSKIIKIKAQKKGSKVQFKATNLKTKKSYKKTLTVKGKTQEPNKYKYSEDETKTKSGTIQDSTLKTYTTLDTPEMQKQIADDIAFAKKTGEIVSYKIGDTGKYFIYKDGSISIFNNIEDSFYQSDTPGAKGCGMLGFKEYYFEPNKTLKNGQYIYGLDNNRHPINIPKGYKVYINIKGYIASMSYIGTEHYNNYYNNENLYVYPTKENYDLCLTSDDKYINDIGRYCEAREGDSQKDYTVYIYRYVICATVYNQNGNLVAYNFYID